MYEKPKDCRGLNLGVDMDFLARFEISISVLLKVQALCDIRLSVRVSSANWTA
jgi:hypothetical protein